jgi:hypothetical protein
MFKLVLTKSLFFTPYLPHNMKKIILLSLILSISLLVDAQSIVPRFGITANSDNTGRSLTYFFQSFTTTSNTAVLYQKPHGYETIYQIGTLKRALTDSLSITNSYVGDKVYFIFVADTLTAGRVVTFGNHTKSSGTLTVPRSKKATAVFIFDGTIWVELDRTLMAN